MAYLAGKYLIGTNAFGNGYSTTFVLAFVLTSAGLWVLQLLLREPDPPTIRSQAKFLDRLKDSPRLIAEDPAFGVFMIVQMLATSARVAAPEPAPVAADPEDVATDRYILRDEIKSSRFADLPAFAEKNEPVLIDCEALNRIDFISAGALLNLLSTVRRQGKQIIFRHPNHLVAELFGVVGLKAVAAIIFARN